MHVRNFVRIKPSYRRGGRLQVVVIHGGSIVIEWSEKKLHTARTHKSAYIILKRLVFKITLGGAAPVGS